MSTGLRWGEVTALQRRDLTLLSKRPTLRVQRAWKRRGEGGGTFLGAPKTKKSRRTLVLTPDQVTLFQRLITGKDPSDLIFTAPEGGAWHSGVFHARRWKPALDAANAAGLTKRPRIHNLRHTHASWLIAGKVPLPVIQACLGHESGSACPSRRNRATFEGTFHVEPVRALASAGSALGRRRADAPIRGVGGGLESEG